MALYAIGDTHLSIGKDKPMDIFGEKWKNHAQKLKDGFSIVGEDDLTVICGDISWGMGIEETKEDFLFIDALPGKKIILKGNHDYWWNTMTKMNAFLEENSFDSIKFLFNNAYLCDGISVCGTRGWFYDAENDENTEKIILREAARLRTSIKAGRELGGEPVVFLHYPPVSKTQICQPIVDVLKEENIKHCYYAHLHSASAYNSFNGEMDGIKYELLSADYLKFCPKPIQL